MHIPGFHRPRPTTTCALHALMLACFQCCLGSWPACAVSLAAAAGVSAHHCRCRGASLATTCHRQHSSGVWHHTHWAAGVGSERKGTLGYGHGIQRCACIALVAIPCTALLYVDTLLHVAARTCEHVHHMRIHMLVCVCMATGPGQCTAQAIIAQGGRGEGQRHRLLITPHRGQSAAGQAAHRQGHRGGGEKRVLAQGLQSALPVGVQCVLGIVTMMCNVLSVNGHADKGHGMPQCAQGVTQRRHVPVPEAVMQGQGCVDLSSAPGSCFLQVVAKRSGHLDVFLYINPGVCKMLEWDGPRTKPMNYE